MRLSEALTELTAGLHQSSDDFADTAHRLFVNAGAPELARKLRTPDC